MAASAERYKHVGFSASSSRKNGPSVILGEDKDVGPSNGDSSSSGAVSFGRCWSLLLLEVRSSDAERLGDRSPPFQK